MRLNKQFGFYLFVLSLLAGCAATSVEPEETQALAAAKANTRLGIEYLRTGEYETSRKRLKKAIRLAPNYAGAHDAIAVLYERVGERELAEKHYLKGLRLAPDNSSAYNNYGQFLCQSGRHAEAEVAFKRAVDDSFYQTPWVPLTNAGICLLTLPDRQRAEEYFRHALEKQADYPPALLNMAESSHADGNYMSARGYLQRYQQVAEHGAESLWLAVRVEFALNDHQAWGNYALMLKNRFPDSEQALLLQEWENERRPGT